MLDVYVMMLVWLLRRAGVACTAQPGKLTLPVVTDGWG